MAPDPTGTDSAPIPPDSPILAAAQDIVRAELARRGLTQKELAARIGVLPTRVNSALARWRSVHGNLALVERMLTALQLAPQLADPGNPTEAALAAVREERGRQEAKWGRQSWPDGGAIGASPEMLVLLRAQMSAARERCDAAVAAGEVTWEHILREEAYEAFAAETIAELRAELLQVAAVCVNWVEDIDRRTPSPHLTSEHCP